MKKAGWKNLVLEWAGSSSRSTVHFTYEFFIETYPFSKSNLYIVMFKNYDVKLLVFLMLKHIF